MLDLIKKLEPLHLGVVTGDRFSLRSILDGTGGDWRVLEVPSGRSYNGWTVPNEWFGYLESPKEFQSRLAIPMYSLPKIGTVFGAELKKHVFVHSNLPDAVPYHCDWWYKPWRRDWGICMTRTQRDAIIDDQLFEVRIRVDEAEGDMQLFTWDLPGESPTTIILQAHTCHPHQANDDLSGIAVGIEVMKRLSEYPHRLSYRLLLCPEHFGTIFYLAGWSEQSMYPVKQRVKGVIFLECLGNDNLLQVQTSFTGNTPLDEAFRAMALGRLYFEPFHTIVGNDEVVWEAPGYEVPCVTLTRFPFREYHSNLDTAERLFEAKLQAAVETTLEALEVLESNAFLHRTFDGLPCLSNPQYGLYQAMADPSIQDGVRDRDWHQLMTCLPRYMDGKMSIIDIARGHSLIYRDVLSYVRRWEEKGLLRREPVVV